MTRQKSHGVGCLAAFLFNFYPFFMVLTATKYAWNAMPLFIFIFYGFLYLYFRRTSGKWRFIQGILLGLSCLVWSGAAYLWILFVIHTVIAKRDLRSLAMATIFIAGFFLPALSWSGYIFRETGKKIFISSSLAPSMIDGLVRHPWSKLQQFETVLRAKEKREKGDLENTRDVIQFYKGELKQHPSDLIKFAFYKSTRAWMGTDSEKFDSNVALIQASYLLLGLWGIWFAWGKKATFQHSGLLLAIVIYFWVVTFFVLSTVRYMIPALGLLMIFTANVMTKLILNIQSVNIRRQFLV